MDEGEDSEELGDLHDLNTPLEGDCKLELLDFNSKEGKQTFWHSSAHILGRSLEQEFGGFLTHGPPLKDGFFYDSFLGPKKLKKEDFKKLEKKMQELVSRKKSFDKVYLSKKEALELFKDNPFKVHLINSKIKENALTCAYRCGDLVDLCTGPHIDNTGKIKAFNILKGSAAYWQGNQKLDDL